MKFHSQTGQDRWVMERTAEYVKRNRATFLDVGANHPIEISNTYALEQLGWTGALIENDRYCCDLCMKLRKAPVFEVDATKFDYKSLPIHDFTYLSLDVDSASLDSLRKLLSDGITFVCATIEHDLYRFGPGPRDAMMDLLLKHGYRLDRDNVCNPKSPDMPFEFWWSNPKRI